MYYILRDKTIEGLIVQVLSYTNQRYLPYGGVTFDGVNYMQVVFKSLF